MLGVGCVVVRSLGFGPEGMPAIPDAVAAMRRRGLDVSGHRSRMVTAERIESADLILTSERDHVVKIAGESPTAYRRAFTLPEFCERIASDPGAGGRSLAAWATDLSNERQFRSSTCRATFPRWPTRPVRPGASSKRRPWRSRRCVPSWSMRWRGRSERLLQRPPASWGRGETVVALNALCRRRPRSARPGSAARRRTTASVPTWVAADAFHHPTELTLRRWPDSSW